MALNPDTRIINCCYAGDVHYINVPAMLHHECPVTIMSPDNSPAVIDHPGIELRHAGKRAYTGQASLDRQHEHFKLMLEYPESFFLIHDSDSVMLDPKIPQYLYDNPDTVWSNQVEDGIPDHQGHFPEGWPHVAFQPPYFLSRATIEKMVAVHEQCPASPMMPFIDFYMLQVTMMAGLRWQRFMDCISCPITLNPISHPVERRSTEQNRTYDRLTKHVTNVVQNGGVMILHSVKDPAMVDYFMECRKAYLKGDPNPIPKMPPPERVGGVMHPSHGLGGGQGPGNWPRWNATDRERALQRQQLVMAARRNAGIIHNRNPRLGQTGLKA